MDDVLLHTDRRGDGYWLDGNYFVPDLRDPQEVYPDTYFDELDEDNVPSQVGNWSEEEWEAAFGDEGRVYEDE